jgi:hypothetical protein
MTTATDRSSGLEQCAHICHECQDACLALIPHCLSQGGVHAERDHIGLLIDCAVICGASHNFLHRASPLHRETCRACSMVCTACAKSCARMPDDPAMHECAEACLRCAESCRRMFTNV